MLEALHSDQHEIVKSLFTGFNIYETFLRAILENKSAGEVLADCKTNPSFALVCSPKAIPAVSSPNACAFLAGNLDQLSLKKVVSYLKTFPSVFLTVSLDWPFRGFFEKEGFCLLERLQLTRPFHVGAP